MKKNKFYGFIFYTLLLIGALIASCGLRQTDSTPVRENTKPKRTIKNKILIILGKDYYNRPGILKYMEEEYGLGEENAPVRLLPYPEFIKSTRQPRLRLIAETLEEFKSSIVISIGMPEGGGRYLISESEKNEELTVISLLPMDEALPMEAGSDIVVDFKPPAESLNNTEHLDITDGELMLLLTAAVFAGEDIRARHKEIKIPPIEEFREALFTAKKVLGSTGASFKDSYTVKPYIDSDSGIPSRKYLLIYKNESPTGENKSGHTDTAPSQTAEPEDITDPDKLDGSA